MPLSLLATLAALGGNLCRVVGRAGLSSSDGRRSACLIGECGIGAASCQRRYTTSEVRKGEGAMTMKIDSSTSHAPDVPGKPSVSALLNDKQVMGLLGVSRV